MSITNLMWPGSRGDRCMGGRLPGVVRLVRCSAQIEQSEHWKSVRTRMTWRIGEWWCDIGDDDVVG
jgi:hypothetical protein